MLTSLKTIYKIGPGPSSSHTMGPYKAALDFKGLIPNDKDINIEVILYGSLALTGKGHMTDAIIIKALSDYKTECKFDINTKIYKERSLLAQISHAKDELITPDEMEMNAGGDFNQKKVAQVYREYQAALKSNNALDFDDIIRLTVVLLEENPDIFVIPAHTLYGVYPPKIPEDEIKPVNETGEIVLSRVVIPEYIVVHDGSPRDSTAQNYYVKYKDYIKNVASCEIYSTWPESSIYANILAIQSFTLNRVYTEWYRNQGYDFTSPLPPTTTRNGFTAETFLKILIIW